LLFVFFDLAEFTDRFFSGRAERMRSFVLRIVSDGRVPVDVKFLRAGTVLIPHIENVSALCFSLPLTFAADLASFSVRR
jgi:hypothetical protein